MSFKIFYPILAGIILKMGIEYSQAAVTHTLTEDFSQWNQADLVQSTGVWNTVDQVIQATVVANGETARTIPFGDGSDGVLNSSTGFSFNTDTHLGDYQFQSLTISAGLILVAGSRPLVIRSLSAITLVPPISVSGDSGNTGISTAFSPTSGGAGGGTHAAKTAGGLGGLAVNSTLLALLGGAAVNSDGSSNLSGGGPGSNVSGTSATGGQAVPDGPSVGGLDFDFTGFIAGTGGGGGGGHWNGADTVHASGGGGGGGGGGIRLVALGPITATSISARGGDGGSNATTVPAACSGPGAGGNGGAVWVQSFKSIAIVTTPSISGGAGGSDVACGVPASGGAPGKRRGDSYSSATRPPAWAASGFDTANAAPSQNYMVISKGYDLGTLNAFFTAEPTLLMNLNGGNITVDYAASADGLTYSEFAGKIQDLSNHNYRYLKFRAQIFTAGTLAPSPTLNRVAIAYSESGLAHLNLGLAAGCGSLQAMGNTESLSPAERKNFSLFSFLTSLFWLVAICGLRRLSRRPKSASSYCVSGLIKSAHSK